jgi:hypothetical protein
MHLTPGERRELEERERAGRETNRPGLTDWEAATEPFERRDSRGEVHRFRRYGEAIALVEFGGRGALILRLEALGPAGEGGAVPLVELLTTIARRHDLTLRGQLHAYPTEERPEPDLAALARFYRRLGFEVTGDDPPWINLPDLPQGGTPE